MECEVSDFVECEVSDFAIAVESAALATEFALAEEVVTWTTT
jgi:hypothetical protein